MQQKLYGVGLWYKIGDVFMCPFYETNDLIAAARTVRILWDFGYKKACIAYNRDADDVDCYTASFVFNEKMLDKFLADEYDVTFVRDML